MRVTLLTLLLLTTLGLAAATGRRNATNVGHQLQATVGQLPGNKGLQSNAVYQSSNSDIIWLESSYGESPHSRGTFYAYSPSQQAIVAPTSGIRANDGNHVDQLYYDSNTGFIVAQMEVGENGGQGSYYPKAIDTNGNTVWDHVSLTLHRQHSSNTATMGVTDGMAVVLHDTGRGPGYVELIGIDVRTGTKVYVKKYYQRIRCNGQTATCLAVAEQRDRSVLLVFNARTGATIATQNYGKEESPTLHEVVGKHIVIAIDGQAYAVDCNTGEMRTLGDNTGGGEGLRQYGPNMGRARADGYHFYNVASATEILNFPYQFGQMYASWSMIAFATGSGSQLTWYFYDANTGAQLAKMSLDNPQTGLNWGPFLVGKKLVIPYSLNSYQIVDVTTQTTSMGSYLAPQFAPHAIYLSNGDTFSWNVGEYFQFSGSA